MAMSDELERVKADCERLEIVLVRSADRLDHLDELLNRSAHVLKVSEVLLSKTREILARRDSRSELPDLILKPRFLKARPPKTPEDPTVEALSGTFAALSATLGSLTTTLESVTADSDAVSVTLETVSDSLEPV
jgi:hypothetical protein